MGRTKTIEDAEILRHAREAFREAGHAASTRDIASAAGISQAVIYQRFGSKEDLFCRAMTPDQPDLEDLLGPYPPRSARADLKRIGERLCEYLGTLMPTLLHVLAHPDLGRARLARWHADLPFHALISALTARFQRLRDDGLVGSINPSAAARAFLAAVHSAAILESVAYGGAHHHHGHRGHVDALVEVLWTGLAPDRSVPE
ncbi:MAG TPA: helix-turn-helix domain-containing protein [Polyangiaceae bacterium]|nr:helix-turn-helix domain-containing protein [Polyangiaceae bacterium]